MVGSVKALNALYNQSVVNQDELREIKNALKKGLEEVVESNKKLDPRYVDPDKEVGAWRRVEPLREDDIRPLVQSDADRVMQVADRHKLLKKLDIL